VTQHLQILISRQFGSARPAPNTPTPLGRAKLILSNGLFATIAVAILVVALVLGSIIADCPTDHCRHPDRYLGLQVLLPTDPKMTFATEPDCLLFRKLAGTLFPWLPVSGFE
jgi:hypothetical protein